MKTIHGKLIRRTKIKRIPTKPYDCKNCIHACKYDYLCNWHLHPNYNNEDEPYPCEKVEEESND